MKILTPIEESFLEVFLHEATTAPLMGPATAALHKIGVEYRDIADVARAYEQEVPRDRFEWGHPADEAPPVPWTNRESALQRDTEIQRIWEQERKPVGTPKSR
jgi:hypothetical protein